MTLGLGIWGLLILLATWIVGDAVSEGSFGAAATIFSLFVFGFFMIAILEFRELNANVAELVALRRRYVEKSGETTEETP